MNTEASTDDLFSFGTKNPDNGRTAVPTPEEEIKDFFFPTHTITFRTSCSSLRREWFLMRPAEHSGSKTFR